MITIQQETDQNNKNTKNDDDDDDCVIVDNPLDNFKDLKTHKEITDGLNSSDCLRLVVVRVLRRKQCANAKCYCVVFSDARGLLRRVVYDYVPRGFHKPFRECKRLAIERGVGAKRRTFV